MKNKALNTTVGNHQVAAWGGGPHATASLLKWHPSAKVRPLTLPE